MSASWAQVQTWNDHVCRHACKDTQTMALTLCNVCAYSCVYVPVCSGARTAHRLVHSDTSLWCMNWRVCVDSREACRSDPGSYSFFSLNRFVTEMDRGVRVCAWSQGLRWHACEGRDGLVSMGARCAYDQDVWIWTMMVRFTFLKDREMARRVRGTSWLKAPDYRRDHGT